MLLLHEVKERRRIAADEGDARHSVEIDILSALGAAQVSEVACVLWG